jgi:prevent-host-death family protein
VYATVVSVTVGVRQLRENLSAYLDRVKAGEEVIITERGKRIARMVGPATLDRRVNEGRVRPAKKSKREIKLEELIPVEGPPWPSDFLIADRKYER